MATKKQTGMPALIATPKKTTELRKPQVRVLQALAKSKKPLTRAEIAKKAKVDQAWITEYCGSLDKSIRAKNDRKFKSLLTLGYVKAAEEDGAAVYAITASGRKVIVAAK